MSHRTLVWILLAALTATSLPAVTGAEERDVLAGLPRGSYVMEDGNIAVPLYTQAPDWLTPEVIAAASVAGEKGMGYDFAQGIEVPLAMQFAFIRPGTFFYGTALLEPVGCTMNFVYGAKGTYQIGTAGHCISVGQDALLVTAPTVLTSIGKAKRSQDGGVGADWALIPVFPAMQQWVDPNVAVIMGPEGGVYSGTPSLTNPVPIKHFGHGLAVGAGGTPRAGVMWKMDSKAIYFNSPSAPGDSGSAVLHGGSVSAPLGQAIGVLTHLIVDTKHVPSHMAGTRMSVIPTTPTMGDVVPLP